VDITVTVSDALNSILNSAIEKKVRVEDKVPKILAMGDKNSLTQALVTILDNAIKYSHDGGKISVSATKDQKYVYISAKDEDIGIRAVHLPHIFDRFYHVEASRNKQEDEGMALV